MKYDDARTHRRSTRWRNRADGEDLNMDRDNLDDPDEMGGEDFGNLLHQKRVEFMREVEGVPRRSTNWSDSVK